MQTKIGMHIEVIIVRIAIGTGTALKHIIMVSAITIVTEPVMVLVTEPVMVLEDGDKLIFCLKI